MSPPRPSVVIPTLDGARHLPRLVAELAKQTVAPMEVIALDSESGDGTPDLLRSAGARVITVPRSAFHHARVRNQGANLARGDALVFMTQDAVPARDDALERLLAPITAHEAAASYARQVPRRDASPLERYARSQNYPDVSHVVTHADIASRGLRAFFFSNACSAVATEAFRTIGGFPTHTIMNEDMLLASRLLHAGFGIAYAADAIVEHSHDYTPLETLRRYFDIGVTLRQAREDLTDGGLAGDGRRYVAGLLSHLARTRQYAWLLPALAESAAKAAGVVLGRRHERIPVRWKRSLSLHRAYWQAPDHDRSRPT